MSVGAVAAEARAEPAVPSWRGGFGRLWSAAVVSRFGDGMRNAALPLLATSLTRSPLLVSLVTAAGYLPWIVFGLLGGALADRIDQRRAMRTVDGVRALLTGGFALAVALGHAGIGLLLALAFALTTLQTLFDNAATALLPAVVPRSALGRANARLMTGQTIAGTFLAAPLVPAALAFAAGAPFAADAVTFAVAAALVASLPGTGAGAGTGVVRAPRPAGRTLRQDIAEGIAVLWRDRVLRGLCAACTVANIGVGMLVATLVLTVTGWLHAGHAGFAATLTAYGVGSVAGGVAAGRLPSPLTGVRALPVALVVQAGCLVVLGTVRTLPAAIAAMAVFGALAAVWNVTTVTLFQQRGPAGTLGRISAANRTLSVAGAPLGALLGGMTATAWGLNTPPLAAAALFLCASAVLIPTLAAAG